MSAPISETSKPIPNPDKAGWWWYLPEEWLEEQWEAVHLDDEQWVRRATGREIDLVNMPPGQWLPCITPAALTAATAAKDARIQMLEADYEKLNSGRQVEIDALREALREDRVRVELCDDYETWLDEIGQSIGCGHINEALPGCVRNKINELELCVEAVEVREKMCREELQAKITQGESQLVAALAEIERLRKLHRENLELINGMQALLDKLQN